MKFNNRKGSTLALTLIIFAVLMIFATFIMSFMVTENKQAMYYQNKTQAYYIAKSGAEVVGAALIDHFNELDTTSDFNELINHYKSPQNVDVNIENIINPIKIAVEKIENQDLLTITSTAEFSNVQQTVKKVLFSEYNRTTKSEMTIDGGELLIFLSDEDGAIKEKYPSNIAHL